MTAKDFGRTPDQFAALCWRRCDGVLQYLLVTSRRTGRWIFPKGGPDAHETPGATAAREAREEAGVVGQPAEAPLGRYLTLKVTPEQSRWLIVELWPVEITEIVDHFDEAGLRHRRMVTASQARALLEQENMRNLIERFERSYGTE